MKYFIPLLSLLIFTFSCTRLPPHAKAGYRSIHEHIETMGNSEQWLTQSIGGSFYDGDVKKLHVSFIVPADNFNIDYARALMVKGIETFLTSINTTDQLIPYLNHYPFTFKDIKYGISLYTHEGKLLGYISLIKGGLTFYKTNEFNDLDEVHEEPYPEALYKIKAGLAVPVPQLQNPKPLSS